MKNHFLFTLLTIFIIIVSCSSPTTEVVVPEKKPEVVIRVDEAATPCKTLADLDPAIRSDTEDAFTLYKDGMRFKKFDEARSLWRVAYYRAPGANGRMTSHFDDGIKIYDHYFKNETDDSKKAAYVDTILSIYDKRMECFEDDGTILARRGFNMYYSYSKYCESDEIFEIFKEVIRKKDIKADYFIVNPLSKLLYDRVYNKEISNEEGSTIAYKIFDIIEHGKANCKDKYCDAWEVIDQYSPPLLSGLEGFKGFYNCKYFMDKYFSQYEADPKDCDNITEVYLKMVWGGCDASDPRFIELKEAKEKECYVPPPPPGPCKEAYTLLNQGLFNEAIAKYEECAATKSDPVKKAEVLIIISKIYYAHIKNFPQARKFAREAANLKPNWGEPFLIIGKLYASSGPLCGPGTGWDSQIVTWAAIDKFNHAKKIDPSVSEEANKWIGRYSKYMPNKEDIFFRQIKKGAPFTVPCWIQERTFVRTSD